MSRKFAISSLEEARAYLRHPVLGPRLVECTMLVNNTIDLTIGQIFGSPDDLKFRSSMTLFARAASDNEVFENAIRKFFQEQYDPLTLQRL